jgi:hypothetical protein
MLIKLLIYLSICSVRIFKGKRFACLDKGRAYFIVDEAYDRVIRDYYTYIARLLANALVKIESPSIILLDSNNFSWLRFFLPIKKIILQIEHTLVKPGGRDSDGAMFGHIGILGRSDNYLVRLANFQTLNNADAVIDYSQINQFNISKSIELAAYYSKSFCISPALYSLEEDSFSFLRKRDIDTVTMFGNSGVPRRQQFLDSLALAGVNSQNINNIFESTDKLYRNMKILINIRQTNDHDTLEELRVLPALRCGVIVISEHAPLVQLTRYSKYIVWGELHELPAIALDVQKNYDQWHARIFGNIGFIRRMNRIARRNELISFKLARLLNDQLLKTKSLEVA